MKLKNICVHCREQGSEDFLLRIAQIQARNMKGGFYFFPIRIQCVDDNKNVLRLTGSKKNNSQARTESIATAGSASARNIN